MNRETSKFPEFGYVVIDNLVGDNEISDIEQELRDVPSDTVGDRRFLDREWCRLLAHVVRHRLLKLRLLYRASRPVLCTYFSKAPDNNWAVGLHRDMHVPLRSRLDDSRWQNWTEKQDIPHAQASRDLLSSMLAVRLNIDHCAAGGGSLQVVPRSQHGVEAVDDRVECTAERGSAIVMSPLILHGSSKTNSDVSRRVLHFLFGPESPPGDAAWYYEI